MVCCICPRSSTAAFRTGHLVLVVGLALADNWYRTIPLLCLTISLVHLLVLLVGVLLPDMNTLCRQRRYLESTPSFAEAVLTAPLVESKITLIPAAWPPPLKVANPMR